MPILESGTLIAHRGACAHFPENTLLAFQGAHDMGATWVETDVMLTLDNVPILFHDEHLARITGTKQYIANSTYAELKDLDVGSWLKPQFSDARIPTLAESLHLLQKLGLKLNLEIKPTLGKDKITAEKAIDIVVDAQFPADEIIISSFSLTALEAAYAKAPNYRYGFIADDWPCVDVAMQSKVPWYSLHLNQKMINTQTVRDLKKKQYKVLTFTINEAPLARAFFNMGVDGIFTDYPHLMQSSHL